jgi:hypothetical protein
MTFLNKNYRIPEFHPAQEKILLRNRRDREGTNWINKAANFVRAKFGGANIYYNYIKYEESVFTQPFVNFCEQIKDEEIEEVTGIKIPEKYKRSLGHPFSIECGWDCSTYLCNADATKEIKLDLLSAFQKYFKKDFFNYIQRKDSHKKSLWKAGEKIICVHLRLEDVSHRGLNDQGIIYDQARIKDYIEENQLFKTDGRRGRKRIISQVPSRITDIKRFIDKLKVSHPSHQIHFITAPGSGRIVREALSGYQVHVPDKNEALWSMVNSDILVLSRSMFSAMAGFLHQGNLVYYPPWGFYTSMGFGTRFDETKNWRPACIDDEEIREGNFI